MKVLIHLWAWPAYGQHSEPTSSSSLAAVVIPKVATAPSLEDYLEMEPNTKFKGQLAEVHTFMQREPTDGAPATERTDAYLGYDASNLYIIFVCFDSDPRGVHAHLTQRERIFDTDDDAVEVMLDTFDDHRHGYTFISNPYGIQWDAIFSEGRNDSLGGSDVGNFDKSWDALWYSRGTVTSRGYVVWMAVPFRSLRFQPKPDQTWGLILNRTIARRNENDFWPYVSSRVRGRLNQEGTAKGLSNISPGRNMQFTPYIISRSFRTLDLRDPFIPQFVRKDIQGRVGLDSKIIIKDSLVLDATANPDFSQVESDQPQIILNQRFELLFPELRPFFQENGNFFETPSNLVFTRRIADPEFGLRLTGKLERYGVGLMWTDDRAPGEIVSKNDISAGKRARVVVGRLTRDILNQSKLGVIYTDREFANTSNRVGGVDGRFKLNSNWITSAQVAMASTRHQDATYSTGPLFQGVLNRTGRQFNYIVNYLDISPGFQTELGFIPRIDLRDMSHFVTYDWRPEGKRLISWGPQLWVERTWDHKNTLLDDHMYLNFHVVFRHETSVDIEPIEFHNERLRPQDLSALKTNVEFPERFAHINVQSNISRFLSMSVFYNHGRNINFLPPKSGNVDLDTLDQLKSTISLRPARFLQIRGTYLFESLHDVTTGRNAFTNHIIRGEVNQQFTRELSFRFIGQYGGVLSNPQFSSAIPAKNFNADALFTYLLHPGTAIYVGYNSDLSNIDRRLIPDNGDLRRTNRYMNDGRLLFVKLSYQIHF